MMMTRLMIAALLCGFLVGPSLAEDQPAAAKKPIKTMIDYKDELGLTDTEITQVKEALTSFQSTVKEQRAILQASEKEYRDLMKAAAPLPDIKSKLRQIADARFNLRYADVLTSRRVSDIMGADKMQKWRAIQAKVRAKK